jgi:hypothetical protein
MERRFVERLESETFSERWLLTQDGESRELWLHYHHDETWFERARAILDELRGPIHPRISTVLDVRRLEDQHLAIECDDVRGPTLEQASRQLADPDEREPWTIAQIIGVADALTAVRRRHGGFVHAQLDSDRLTVDTAGHARARAPLPWLPVRTNTRVGAVDWNLQHFSAPELLRSEPPGAASNVFTLALNLYFALAGEHPWPAESMMERLVKIISEPAPRLLARTPGLHAVVDRALAKDPAARIPDPETFADELRRLVPDAAAYDAVISDRIVAWRATATTRTYDMPQQPCARSWTDLPAGEVPGTRRCADCNRDVAQVGASVLPLLYCRAPR